jgi:hypothetical protein
MQSPGGPSYGGCGVSEGTVAPAVTSTWATTIAEGVPLARTLPILTATQQPQVCPSYNISDNSSNVHNSVAQPESGANPENPKNKRKKCEMKERLYALTRSLCCV